jgi:hypothetical protein
VKEKKVACGDEKNEAKKAVAISYHVNLIVYGNQPKQSSETGVR